MQTEHSHLAIRRMGRRLRYIGGGGGLPVVVDAPFCQREQGRQQSSHLRCGNLAPTGIGNRGQQPNATELPASETNRTQSACRNRDRRRKVSIGSAIRSPLIQVRV